MLGTVINVLSSLVAQSVQSLAAGWMTIFRFQTKAETSLSLLTSNRGFLSAVFSVVHLPLSIFKVKKALRFTFTLRRSAETH
jgi:hypothetical protein